MSNEESCVAHHCVTQEIFKTKKNILQMICSKTEKKEEFFASKRTFENVKKILQTISSKKEINLN